MRKHFFFAAAAALALCFASCQKEEERTVTHFTAGMEQAVGQNGQKAQLNNGYFEWEDYDEIKVWGTSNQGVTFEVTPREDDPTWADLGSGSVTGSQFTAIYPAEIAPSRNTVTLSRYQMTFDGTPFGFPMYAESDNSDVFQFKNLCGALKIHVEQANTLINGIIVHADQNIAGTYTIVNNNGIPQLTNCTNGFGAVSLTCEPGVDVTDGYDFYVFLPPSDAQGYALSLEFEQLTPAHESMCCTKTCSQRIVVERSKITNINIGSEIVFRPAHPVGALSGAFSVSDTRKVCFAKGNLQCNNDRWSLHTSQWASASDPTADHFAWSSTDYGTNMGSAWSTLTESEWTYLCSGRQDATSKCGLGRIETGTNEYVNGFVILPDTWNCPTGLNFTATNMSTSSYATNSYTLDEWNAMEIAGAVFLPAVSYVTVRGTRADTEGYYMCLTEGRYFGFDWFSQTGFINTYRSGSGMDFPVRLVCEY